MKKLNFLIIIFLFSLNVFAQDNMFTLSGGYAIGKPEDSDENTTGYRINGLYEYNPNNGVLAHGFSFGFIHTSGETTTEVGLARETKEIKINSLPLYYAPKFIFGKSNFKAFIKGALGLHFGQYSATGSSVELEGSDFGVFLGIGGGLMYSFNEKIFINAEYEWDYLSNSYYDDGFIQTVQLGIGTRF